VVTDPGGTRALWKAAAVEAATAAPQSVLRRTRRLGDRVGDVGLYGLAAGAAVLVMAIIAGIVALVQYLRYRKRTHGATQQGSELNAV